MFDDGAAMALAMEEAEREAASKPRPQLKKQQQQGQGSSTAQALEGKAPSKRPTHLQISGQDEDEGDEMMDVLTVVKTEPTTSKVKKEPSGSRSSKSTSASSKAIAVLEIDSSDEDDGVVGKVKEEREPPRKAAKLAGGLREGERRGRVQEIVVDD